MSTYELVDSLPLEVESYELEGLTSEVSSGFTRRTTRSRSTGSGEEGVGEDVTYDAGRAGAAPARGPGPRPRRGAHDRLVLGAPRLARPLSRTARRRLDASARTTAAGRFESAALDLALRQAGRSLAEALGREAGPVRFVVLDAPRASRRPPAAARGCWSATRARGFKLDPTSEWTTALVAELAGLGRRGHRRPEGRLPRHGGRPAARSGALRARRRGIPGRRGSRTRTLTRRGPPRRCEPHRDRVTLGRDRPLRSPTSRRFRSRRRGLNIKPSRFGSLRALLDAYDYCAERGIGVYGGGQFELGPGRGQIQTWPRSSSRTGRTTWRRRLQRPPCRARGCRPARCRRTGCEPAFVGRETLQPEDPV